MSETDSSDEEDIPPKAVCEERCQTFATLTGTDTALAFCYLRQKKWCLQEAVNTYFDTEGAAAQAPVSLNKKAASSLVAGKATTVSTSKAVTSQTRNTAANAATSATVVDPQPHRIRIISWNIDGLDDNNLRTRTTAVCSVISQEKPDVVFLQEVVPQTLVMIEDLCPTYQVIPAGRDGYFTAMLLSVQSVEYKEHHVQSFYSSIMSRNLLSCQVKVKGIDMTLMTSHLESTAPHAVERKKQLTLLLKAVKDSTAADTVIVGGDLNLRDKEMQEYGGLPDNILDLWEVTGKRPEAKFTWDLMRNDNLEWNQRFKPRCRFDRVFLRHPTGTSTKLKPVYFELVGIERIQSCGRFPSDHWGILTHFDKT